MFKYSDINKVSQPRELQRKVVTEARKVTYLNNNPDPKSEEPLVTEGWEIVSEMVVSQNYPLITPIFCESKTIDNRFEVPKENKWKD